MHNKYLSNLPATKKEAKAKKELHYFTGKPCKYGHIAKRYASTRTCVMCHEEKSRENFANLSNNEKAQMKIRAKKTYDKNPHNAAKGEFRKMKHNPVPSWYEQEESQIKQIYLKRNELNEKWGIKLEVDHIIPLQSDTVCGLHCAANLQILDGKLNASKRNHYTTDW